MAKGNSGGRRGGGNGTSLALQREAVEWYVSGEGQWINQHLRGRMGDSSLTENEEQLLKGLDAATANNIGERTLYRSVDASAVFGDISQSDYEDLLNRMVYGDAGNKTLNAKADSILSRASEGKQYTEKGFMSTTIDADIAHDWGDFTGSSKPIVLKLKTKSTTKGKDLTKHSMGQGEFLLARNQKWHLTKIGVESVNGNTNIVVYGEFD